VPSELTNLLERWKAGDARAGEEVVLRTYPELRRLARAYLRHERPDHTLQTTALLHEAYLRLLRTGPGSVDSRDAFFRLMAAEMRRRLIDHARRRLAEKRGGRIAHTSLDSLSAAVPAREPSEDDGLPERLDRALIDLNALFPRAARVVQLKFFVGLTTEEAAAELGLSPGTVKRDWTFARAWLAAAMEGQSL
jgi:RNA polymerase sigma factor (TIGR02999 family)